MDKSELSVARYHSLIRKFKQSFPPVKEEISSNHLLTTKDIIKIMMKHDPLLTFVDIDIVLILEDEGYISIASEENGELGFYWLCG